MILNEVDNIKVGDSDVDKVYIGDNLIWANYTYRQVEYIKSTGTQYITTDIIPSFTDRFVIDTKFSANTLTATGGRVFGMSQSGGSLGVDIKNGSWGSYMEVWFYMGFGWASGQSNELHISYSDVTNRVNITLQHGVCYWGTNACSANYNITMGTPTVGIAIFGTAAVQSDTSVNYIPLAYREMYLYSFKIYNGETLLHNLIPVERQSDGELGLYDTLTDKFYGNAGTGTFEKGGYV